MFFRRQQMEKIKTALFNAKTKLAQMAPEMQSMAPELDSDINLAINDLNQGPPQIETFAKPESKISLKDSNGVIHSFAVEIKSSKNGSIPDTELMSKILQAIEGRTTSEMSNVSEYGNGEPQRFEVVSFKYERKDEKSK